MFSSNTSQVSSGGYEIQRSLRFNSADSAYLNRTPASAGNLKTFTFSAWVKRSEPGNAYLGTPYAFIYSAGTSNASETNIGFVNNKIEVSNAASGVPNAQLRTTAVYRDFSAWYHVVVAWDTTQATASNRIKIYVNGVQQTAFDISTYPAQNTDSAAINAAVSNIIGTYNTTSFPVAAYLTEVNFIDGQALTPSSFGAFDAQTGVWGPTPYAGSYGTNGFYLNFSDNSNTTAATLGKDYSGNGNNWTPNNFSVSAGAGNDSLVDVPTNWGTDTGVGGSVRGNYCTLNPLSTTAGTYTQGNLRYVGASSWRRSNATISRTDGKWYWEVTLGTAPLASPRNSGSAWNAFGFGLATVFNSTTDPSNVTDAVVLADNAYYKNFSGAWTDYGTAFQINDVLSIAVDLDANTFTFYRNNTQVATGTIGGTAGRELVPIIISYDGTFGVMDCNFGQRPFAYTAPSGFRALNTQNLPTPTIGATTATQAGKFFNPVLWTGNGSLSRGITGVGFQPDFVWMKARSSSFIHGLSNVVAGANKMLISNLTNAEITDDPYGYTSAFNSDGFTITGGSVNNDTFNGSGVSMVAWNWKANGAGVTNTAGSITSTVSANTTSGFSIATFTTGNTSTQTWGHGLGVAPAMVITRWRNASDDWYVYHRSLGATQYIRLNTTGAAVTLSSIWNNTAPTSSVVTFGSSFQAVQPMVAYCFAEVPGYSRFGSYTGNGSADGPFVFCGFRPAYVLVKTTGTPNDWAVFDVARNTFNSATGVLYPNLANAEAFFPAGGGIDILSNGFKMRADGLANGNGNAYIFAAFAEAPQKFALAR